MASQESGCEILEKLSEWPTEKLKCQLDQVLPELLSCLTHLDKGNVLPAVHALLVICLPNVPLAVAEKDVLHHALPATKQLFFESMEGIKLRLADYEHHTDEAEIIDTLSSLLQVCVELLKCMDSVLLYVISQGSVTISEVSSVPITVVSILLGAFRHCKESEALYGQIFSAVADILSVVFRQCYQVQVHLFEAMTLHIHFNCSIEDDVSLLVEILQVLCQIGEQLIGLDVKSMAEHWKGFAKLVQQHLQPLQQRLNVSYPLCYLSQEVEKNLDQLMKPGFNLDPKAVSKLLKTTSFILKMIVKLAEQFGSGGGFLGDCCPNLLQLLLSLHRYSPPSLTENVDSYFLNDIERHVTVAADPLLIHLITENDFREEYFRKAKDVQSKPADFLPFLLLNISVLRKLLYLSVDKRDLWLGNDKDRSVIGCLLESLKIGHLELCSEVSLQVAIRSGEPSKVYDLYEGLVCHCAAVVVCATRSQFNSIEHYFLDAVLDSYFWPAMLAADVWCVCIRAASADVALDLVLYLADIVCSITGNNISGRQSCKHVMLLLQRMFALLSDKGKQSIVELYPFSKYPYLWKIIGLNNLTEQAQEVAKDVLLSNSLSCVSAFFDGCANVASFKEMLYSLYGMQAVYEYTQPSELTKSELHSSMSNIMSQLWDFATEDLFWSGSSGPFQTHGSWFASFFEILCACTQHLIQAMTDSQIHKMLSQFQNVLYSNSLTPKYSLLKVLHGLATKNFNTSSDQVQICSLIAVTFENLLQDSNPILKESALESFEYFAHCTAHENILAKAVGGNETVRDLVAQYLKTEPPVPGSIEPRVYFKIQGSRHYIHQCSGRKQKVPGSPLEQKPNKKIRTDVSDLGSFLEDDLLQEFIDEDVCSVVRRICSDTQFLHSYSFRDIPSQLQADLKVAANNLCEFIET